MAASSRLRKYFYFFIAGITILRIFIAASIELGNDEVYYWTYALFPDWSHFDHPPMLGWIIQLFTFNLWLQDELFLRMGSIVIAVINSFLIFYIGNVLWSERSGFLAVMIYNFSIYFSVIAGIFVMPDAPQVLFWMISIVLFVHIMQNKNNSFWIWIALGVAIGFSSISKYHSIYLWFAIIGYYILYKRKSIPYLKIVVSGIFTIMVILPVVYWNYQNEFISFTFHGGRVNPENFRIRFDYFFAELFGGMFYQNPFIFFLILVALVFVHKHRLYQRQNIGFLLLSGLPVIIIFLSIALFRRTLPHWSGPGYISLILIAAYFLSEKSKKLIPVTLQYAGGLFFIVLIIALLQINHGLIVNKQVNDFPKKQAASDLTLEMYGWEEIGNDFRIFIQKNPVYNNLHILTYKWFPAAHIDYYIARKTTNELLVLGPLKDIHKYYWINKKRNNLNVKDDALYLTFSHNYKQPQDRILYYFEEYELVHKIPVFRSGKTVKYCFVYLMKDYKGNFAF